MDVNGLCYEPFYVSIGTHVKLRMSGYPDDNEDSTAAPSFLQRVACWGLRSLVHMLSFTFLRVNHFYGACVGRVLWWSDNELKRTSEANLSIAFPEMPEFQRSELLKQSLVELGKTITELGPTWCWSDRRLKEKIHEVRGTEVIDAANEAGRGVIILAPHFGAWEMVGLHLSMNYKIVSLYRPPRLKAIDGFMRDVRQRFGAQLVPTNVSGVRAICRSLRDNEMVGILPDQDPGESGGVEAPFFGHSARTMLLVSRLARKTDSVVVFCVAERLSKGLGYRLHFAQGNSEIASSDELAAATALNDGVESIIKINPAQYLWSYKRYKGTSTPQVNPYRRKAA